MVPVPEMRPEMPDPLRRRALPLSALSSRALHLPIRNEADRATRAMFKIVKRLDPEEECNDLP